MAESRNKIAIQFFIYGLLGLILSPSILAQQINSKDFIVTLEDDTIYGFIQSLTDNKISFAHASDKAMEVKKYKISSLKCVVLKDTIYKGVTINPQAAPSTLVLMKLIQEGPVNLFHREIRKNEMWKANEEQNFTGFIGKVYFTDVYLVKKAVSYKIDKVSFETVCPMVFFDIAWIKQKFRENKYSFENLEQLVMDYNYLVYNPIGN